MINIALAGNPNCGKTALFNALTGARQKVGNWPGVTVDRKEGCFSHHHQECRVVDLPGIYSLAVYDEQGAVDQRIACEYLLSDEPEVILNVIDGANLERNLYLTMELLALGLPVVLAVNMMDIVEKRGIHLDLKKLSKTLGCPVHGIVANRGEGIEDLKCTLHKIAKKSRRTPLQLTLPGKLNAALSEIGDQISDVLSEKKSWLSLRLLEGDVLAQEMAGFKVCRFAKRQATSLEKTLGEEPDIIIADARYGMIRKLVLEISSVKRTRRQTMSEWFDKIVLNRYLGVPIFLFVMYLMFLFSIGVAGAFQDFFDIGSTTLLVDGTRHFLTQWHVPGWLIAILANGVGKGINTTITFIPVIGGMFLFLSFLEDCGYMARAAFVMDRCMRAIGLPGKSFVPMIVGFGCNVPAVMGARTLENQRDRILTVMMMPFMSCGARLAIFAVFAAAFFQQGGALVIFALYLTGILVAVLTGLLLRKTLLPGKPAPLVMELPPYHLPQVSSLFRHAWQRLKRFLTRASKVIIPVCILIGTLNSISMQGTLVHSPKQQTLLSEVGKAATPLLAPIGIKQDNWQATVGLVTGILAKEVVVGTLNTLYSQSSQLHATEQPTFNLNAGLKAALMSIPANLASLKNAILNPLVANEAPHEVNAQVYGIMYHQFDGKLGAFVYLLFVLLYFPCISTLAAMRREVGKRWAYFSVAWSTGFAYFVSMMVYQMATLPRHVTQSVFAISLGLLLFVITLVVLRRFVNERHLEAAG